MVQAVRRGVSMRQVADLFDVALATVQRWVARARGQRLDRVDWTDRPCGLPTPVNRTERHREDLVLTIRQQLHDTSDLGEFGAAAIHRLRGGTCLTSPMGVPSWIALMASRAWSSRAASRSKSSTASRCTAGW